ncbi:MAG: glycosyl hydrolase [Candidatus Kapabacteria bacterium]|nr:glycosyl hydrolase [Candidatus Kapabacteria bacterium]
MNFAAACLAFILLVSSVFAQPTPSSADLDISFRGMQFRNIGPFRAGRSLAVAGHPDLPSTYYFGATGGGVWKTEDGGDTWRAVSDTTFNTSSVGAICIAPSDPNVVYVGMGETDIRGNISPGDGVYRSNDGGNTWLHLGLNNAHMIADIVVHPEDADVVLVSSMGNIFTANAERGIFKSTDGGKNWRKVLYRNDSTCGMTLKMDPNNPRIVYASLWQAYRNAFSMSSGGAGSGLFKSIDGGETWKEITKNTGMPKGTLGKINVDVSRVQRSLVWAMIEGENGGLFKSVDAGQTWQRTSTSADLRQRPWYFNHVYADPTDANVVYVLNVGWHKSIDGGRTFSGMGSNHGDHHDLWIDPKNSKRMILGDDGGAVVSEDGGRHWTEDDLATAQFYHVSVDNHFPYRLYGAQQDNSTCSIPSRIIGGWSIDRSDWYSVAGFESGYVVPHPTDPDITFGGNYSGYLGRKSLKLNQEQDISVYPNNPIGEGAKDRGERFQWTFPIVFSPHDASVMYTTSQHVWRTTNEGMSWTKISGDLTRNDTTKQIASGGPITKDNTGVEVYNTIFTFAESSIAKGTLWAGSDCGLIHVSTNGGTSWSNVTPSGLKESLVSIIESSPFDGATAYAAINRYKHGDDAPYIYKTTNNGTSWSLITKGIPSGAFVRVVREDPFRKGLLYAGTERGLYTSFDAGASWSRLRLNLPTTPIHDLVVHPTEKDLVVCTHGRSFWILDDLTPLHQYDASSKRLLNTYSPRHTYRVSGGSWSSPTMSVGQNAPNGVLFNYSLRDTTSKELRLTIRNDRGDSIITFSSVKDLKGEPFKPETSFHLDSLHRASGDALTLFKGLNRFSWNMSWPPAEELEGALLWAGGTGGPTAMPGRYTATFTLGADTQTVAFELRVDPRLTTPKEDLQAQFDLHQNINAKLSDVHKAIKRIREVRSSVSALTVRWKSLDTTTTKEISTLAKKITDSLTTIENALVQTKAKAFQDLLNYPVKLNNKIASLASVASSADRRPTQQTYDLFETLRASADGYLTALKGIDAVQIEELNSKFKQLDLPAIPKQSDKK